MIVKVTIPKWWFYNKRFLDKISFSKEDHCSETRRICFSKHSRYECFDVTFLTALHQEIDLEVTWELLFRFRSEFSFLPVCICLLFLSTLNIIIYNLLTKWKYIHVINSYLALSSLTKKKNCREKIGMKKIYFTSWFFKTKRVYDHPFFLIKMIRITTKIPRN